MADPPPKRPTRHTVGVAPDQKHVVDVSAWPKLLLRLQDSGGNKLANAEYALAWSPAPTTGGVTAVTDGDGVVRQPVPPGVARATITLTGKVGGQADTGPRWSVEVEFVSLSPPSVGIAQGIDPFEARLSNLGFLATESRADALDQYRASLGLPENPPAGMTSDNYTENLHNQLIADHDT